jgi:hypothetical protein
MEPRLKAEIWVKAHIRKCAFWNVPVFVVKRGDDTAGAVLIKVNRLDDRCMVLTPITNFDDGTRQWLRATGDGWVSEQTCTDYIAKQLKFDRDLWVIEIEDAEGRHLLDEKITS